MASQVSDPRMCGETEGSDSLDLKPRRRSRAGACLTSPLPEPAFIRPVTDSSSKLVVDEDCVYDMPLPSPPGIHSSSYIPKRASLTAPQTCPIYLWAWLGKHSPELCAKLVHPLYGCLTLFVSCKYSTLWPPDSVLIQKPPFLATLCPRYVSRVFRQRLTDLSL